MQKRLNWSRCRLSYGPAWLGPTKHVLDGVCCGQMAAWINMPLGMEVGLGTGDFVLDGDPACPNRGHSPPLQFSAHFYCGQTAGCIKMPLGMEIGLSPGDFVLDRDPALPSPRRGRGGPPNFRPLSIVAKRLEASRWHLAWRWALVQPNCARWG